MTYLVCVAAALCHARAASRPLATMKRGPQPCCRGLSGGLRCLQAGDTLYTASMKPIMTFLEETGPGCHDTTAAACSYGLYVLQIGEASDYLLVCSSTVSCSKFHLRSRSIVFGRAGLLRACFASG